MIIAVNSVGVIHRLIYFSIVIGFSETKYAIAKNKVVNPNKYTVELTESPRKGFKPISKATISFIGVARNGLIDKVDGNPV